MPADHELPPALGGSTSMPELGGPRSCSENRHSKLPRLDGCDRASDRHMMSQGGAAALERRVRKKRGLAPSQDHSCPALRSERGDGTAGEAAERESRSLQRVYRENAWLRSQLSHWKKQRKLYEAKAHILYRELAAVYGGAPMTGLMLEEDYMILAHKELHRDGGLDKAAKRRNPPAGAKHLPEEIPDYEPVSTPKSMLSETQLEFLTYIMATKGIGVCTFFETASVGPEARQMCLDICAKEFYAYMDRCNRMQKLVARLEEVSKLAEYSAALAGLVDVVCDCLECDRGTVWICDPVSVEAWTQIRSQSDGANEGKMMNVRISLADSENGFVAAAYHSRDSVTGQPVPINIVDAYQDHRFNRAVDVASGYRTKAVLAMPIVKNDRVMVVLQAVNKLTAPHFTAADESLIRVIGSVSLNIVERCEQQQSVYVRKLDRALIREADESGEGEIDRYEFLRYMIRKWDLVSEETLARIEANFDELDVDGSGVLDRKDLQFMNMLGGTK
mmetsp:Transcript_78044/g.208625  ORF Transcript_78044/g.208625 Transcript_78044/m.208625 type:complete len:504 (+) Transcript_78044:58-1569(+)